MSIAVTDEGAGATGSSQCLIVTDRLSLVSQAAFTARDMLQFYGRK